MPRASPRATRKAAARHLAWSEAARISTPRATSTSMARLTGLTGPTRPNPPRYPSPFLQQRPRTRGALYSHIQFQTNGTPDLSYFFGTLKSATLPLPTVDAAQSFNFTAADTRFPHRERRPRTRPRRCQPDPGTHRTGHNTDQRGHRRRHHGHSSHRRRPRHCVRRRHPETHHTNLNVVAGQPPPTSSSPVSTPTAPSLSSTVPAVPSS
jgi:hypothetical protein